MTQPIATVIERRLAALGTPARAEGEKRYLKSELDHLGATLPATRLVVKDVLAEHPVIERAELVGLVETLWYRGVFDCRLAGVELLRAAATVLEPGDIALIERLIRESLTWALVDPLAEHVAGGLVERFAELTQTLDRWSVDEDFWIRRAAMLALLRPLRRGAGDFERFAGFADRMLEEPEFFIRKAIGWVLRETSRKRPDLVYEWVLPRATRCSGVTIREAVKHLSDGQRAELLGLRPRRARRVDV